MLSSKALKSTSGFALLASAPALVSCAYGSASLEAGSLAENAKALVFNQKEVVKVNRTSSQLPKLILYTFLVVAGLYILGFLEKAVIASNADVELQTNEKLVEYKNKEEELRKAKNKLKFKLEELENILQEIKDNTEKKDNIETGVKGLDLEKYIKVIEDANKDEKFMKILKLRQELLEYWQLTYEWTSQNGFRTRYESFGQKWGNCFCIKKEPTFEQLKWLDGEFIAKEEDPLSYPEESLKYYLEGFQPKQYQLYPLIENFFFSSFKGKTIQQLSAEDFNKAQEELIRLKQSNINDYNRDKKFSREFDELSEQLKKFQKDFENFKKAQEKLKEIRKLKESFNENLFSDSVEEKIGKIVTAARKIEAESRIKCRGFDTDLFELVKIQKHCRYIFTEKDFSEIENFVKEVCCEKDIEDKKQSIEELQKAVEAKNLRIADIKKSIEQINKKLESKKDAKQRIEYLNKKQNEVMENLFQFTFPGKYTFFY